MSFKKQYTAEDAQELLAWMDTHPTGRADLGHGIIVEDVALFLRNARYIVETQFSNPIYAGFMATAFDLKNRMGRIKPDPAAEVPATPDE